MPPPNTDADAPPGGVRVHASLPERERRGRAATALSFLFHALIIYLAIRLTAVVTLPERSPIGDAIQLALGGGGGGGGQRGSAFQHTAVPPPPPVVTPAIVPPPPTPTVIPPPPVQPPAPPPASADPNPPASTVAAAGTGTGTGGGNGSGSGTGTGSGQGPGSGSGSGGGNGGGRGGFPPENKQLVIPNLDAPKKLRGKSVEVTFMVSAEGRVTSFTVAPPIEDRNYAKKFDEIIRDFQFKPARDPSGKAVAGTMTMVFTF